MLSELSKITDNYSTVLERDAMQLWNLGIVRAKEIYRISTYIYVYKALI